MMTINSDLEKRRGIIKITKEFYNSLLHEGSLYLLYEKFYPQYIQYISEHQIGLTDIITICGYSFDFNVIEEDGQLPEYELIITCTLIGDNKLPIYTTNIKKKLK